MALKLLLHSVTILYRKGEENSNVYGLNHQAWVPEEEVTVVDPLNLDPPMSDSSKGSPTERMEMCRDWTLAHELL